MRPKSYICGIDVTNEPHAEKLLKARGIPDSRRFVVYPKEVSKIFAELSNVSKEELTDLESVIGSMSPTDLLLLESNITEYLSESDGDKAME